MRAFFLLYLSVSVMACSLYQSDGRKTLEKEAYEYAGVAAVPYLQNCADNENAADGSDWLLISESEKAKIFTSEQEEFALRVESGTFGCQFLFPSAQEMVERTQDAVDLTLLHRTSALSLGEFAFRPMSHVK